MSDPPWLDEVIAPFRKARFGVVTKTGEFIEFHGSEGGSWRGHPLADQARWMGGALDGELALLVARTVFAAAVRHLQQSTEVEVEAAAKALLARLRANHGGIPAWKNADQESLRQDACTVLAAAARQPREISDGRGGGASSG